MFSKTIKFGLLVVVLATGVLLPALAQDEKDEIVATYTFPAIGIAEVQNSALPDSVANDRDILLGGIGSDMWQGPTDADNEFWIITDRGPNGQIRVDDANRRTFPIPDFTPMILHVSVEGDTINTLDILPLINGEGQPITGLSNLEGHDEKPWDYSAMVELEYNQDGLDTEGLVRTSAGEFWLVEEYSPSIVRVSAEGVVLRRFVPEGLVYDNTTYEVVGNLPAILASRRGNRGYEGVALSPDESTLFAAVQSPLRNPDAETGDNSRTVRIIAFDIASETVVGEYVYEFQDAAEFNAPGEPGEMKISGLIALSNTELLVLERTDAVAKIYAADLTNATNILGTEWDDAATSPSLESFASVEEGGVIAVAKTLVIDLDTLEGMPDKIEGIALVDADTLAVINDNDFALGDFDADGNNINNGVPNQILMIDLTQPVE